MRLSVATILGALILTMAAGSGALPGSGGAGSAEASTGTVRIAPSQKLSAWNATAFSVEVQAQNVDTTTLCSLSPNDPNSPQAPCGLGAFEFTVDFDPAKLAFVSASGGTMLESTGRTVDCFDAQATASTVQFQCVTFGQIPLGPEGSGLLAILTFEPLVAASGGSTALTFSDSKLFDIQGNQFPAAPMPGTVIFGVCTDVAPQPSGDGGVDLLDTLAILAHFGETPASDPKWDPTADNSVDLADALYSLAEFGQTCSYP